MNERGHHMCQNSTKGRVLQNMLRKGKRGKELGEGELKFSEITQEGKEKETVATSFDNPSCMKI